MRGTFEVGQLVNEAIVGEKLEVIGAGGNVRTVYRAELRIAGHGTFLGDWRGDKGNADADLEALQAKHTPISKGDGFSTAQHTAIKESLGQIAKRELGHAFNKACEY